MNAGSFSLGVNVSGQGLSYTPANGTSSLATTVKDGFSNTTAFGTAAGQGDLICGFTITLAANANQTIDLYGGALLDVFGVTAPFRHLRNFAAWISSGGDSSGVTIQPGASNPNNLWWGGTSPTKTIYPGGPGEIGGSPAGVVVSNTAKTVEFINNSSAVGVTITVYLNGADS